MRLHIGKIILVLFIAFLGTGCNFFGKKSDVALPTTPGELPDGTSIVGNWSLSTADVSTSRNPGIAYTTTYDFDPLGNARVELKDLHSGGVTCTAYGVYRQVSAATFVIYVRSAVPSICAFSPQIILQSVTISKYLLSYVDTSGATNVLYANNVQQAAPVGLWDFRGTGGIDYLILDAHGYFILQTTSSGVQYLLVGVYVVDNGTLLLAFFSDNNPEHLTGDELYYSQFVTDGTILSIQYTDAQNQPISYNGLRL